VQVIIIPESAWNVMECLSLNSIVQLIQLQAWVQSRYSCKMSKMLYDVVLYMICYDSLCIGEKMYGVWWEEFVEQKCNKCAEFSV